MAIAKLSVDFEARLGQFETELKRISSVADGLSSKLTNSFKGIGLAMAGISAGVGLSTLKDKLDSVIASASGLKEMADQTGASVENLSGLASVAKLTGTEMNLVTGAMNKLSKGLHSSDDEAKGVGKALDFLGVKMKELRGQDPAQNFKIIADRMAELEDGTGKVAIAMALFGKSGAEVLAFMKDLAEVGELQVKTTDAQAAAAKNYEQDLKRLTATKDALYKVVGLELVPAFDAFVKTMIGAKNEANGVLNSTRSLAKDGSISEWASNAVKVAGFVIDAFDGVGRVVTGLGLTIAAGAASLSAQAGGNMEGARAIREAYNKDMSELLGRDQFSAKLEKNLAALKEHQSKVETVTKAYAGYGVKVQSAALKAINDSFYGATTPIKSSSGFVAAATGSGKSSAGKENGYASLITSLNEKISVETAGLQSTEKLNAAQKDYAKYQADISSGALKLSSEQKKVSDAFFETYLARSKERIETEAMKKAMDDQSEAMLRNRQLMVDQIGNAERAAELYGLNASQISVVEQSRLADAIAIAEQNGASEEQIKYLKDELALRGRLSDALIKGDSKRQEIEDAKGKISELDEFSKQAARNMQDSMADFFTDPTKKGIQSIASTFGETVQKMVAQAGSAQLMKLLFGDMGKTGDVGGLVGQGASAAGNWLSSVNWAGLFASFDGGGNTGSGSRSGGVDGKGGFPAILHPQETVIDHTKPRASNSGATTINVNVSSGTPSEVKRAAAAGARTALGSISAAQRYA